MSDFALLRRAVLAGAVAASLTGAAAALDSAEALPAPAPMAQTTAAQTLTTVQYYPYGYNQRFYRYRRPYYGYRRGYYGYGRGRVGLYNCGPYALHTHLSRKACR